MSQVSFGEESIAIYASEKERETKREIDGMSEVSETLEPIQG